LRFRVRATGVEQRGGGEAEGGQLGRKARRPEIWREEWEPRRREGDAC
jgi:hypothetical protein